MVFSCPGTEEKKSGKLVSGKTGENLDIILQYLYNNLSCIFHSALRYDYRITNASNIVHPNETDKRTEPSIKEIKAASNLRRLYNEIKDFTYVISFGNRAERAVIECLKDKEKIPIHIHCKYHLGLQSINRRIKKDINKNKISIQKNNKKISVDNNLKRLEVVYSELFSEIQNTLKSACPATSCQPSK